MKSVLICHYLWRAIECSGNYILDRDIIPGLRANGPSDLPRLRGVRLHKVEADPSIGACHSSALSLPSHVSADYAPTTRTFLVDILLKLWENALSIAETKEEMAVVLFATRGDFGRCSSYRLW